MLCDLIEPGKIIYYFGKDEKVIYLTNKINEYNKLLMSNDEIDIIHIRMCLIFDYAYIK